MKHSAKVFFIQIKNNLPKVVIIASQIELRYVNSNNLFGTPTLEVFKRRRNKFSNFLKRTKEINFLAQIGGPVRLDNRNLYKRDGVHLTSEGVKLLQSLLFKSLDYAYETIRRIGDLL